MKQVQKPCGRSAAGGERTRQRVLEMKWVLGHCIYHTESTREPVASSDAPSVLEIQSPSLRTGNAFTKLHPPHHGALKARCATISWSHLTNSDAVTRHVCAQAGDDFLSADSSQGLSASRFQAPGDVGHRGSDVKWNRSRVGQVTWSVLSSNFKEPTFPPCVKHTVSLNAASTVRWFINFQTLGKETIV